MDKLHKGSFRSKPRPLISGRPVFGGHLSSVLLKILACFLLTHGHIDIKALSGGKQLQLNVQLFQTKMLASCRCGMNLAA